jgi:hypothetical protein
MEILSKGKGVSIEYFVLQGSFHKTCFTLPTGEYYFSVVMNALIFFDVSVAVYRSTQLNVAENFNLYEHPIEKVTFLVHSLFSILSPSDT